MVDLAADAPPEHALVVMAHPDDLEWFVGGTVAAWTAAGARVTALLATSGQHGAQDEVSTPAEIAATREREQRDAAAVLGIGDVQFLHEPDGELQPTLDLRLRLARAIRQARPDVVVLPDPTRYYFDGYVNHPDHRAVGEAALAAVSPAAANRLYHPELLRDGLAPRRVREIWLAMPQHPNGWIDIAAHLPRKLAAMRCHRSQIVDWPAMRAALEASTRLALPDGGIAHRELYHRIRLWSRDGEIDV